LDIFRKKKPFCIDMIVCLNTILKKFRKRMIDMVSDLHEMVNLVLLNGLYEESVDLLKNLCKLNLPNCSQYIQCKLLLFISLILTND